MGQVHGRPDLLRLQHKFTKEELKTAIKKIIVVPDEQLDSSTDLRDSDEKRLFLHLTHPNGQVQLLIQIWQN